MPLILPSLTPSALDATAVVGVMRYCTSLHYMLMRISGSALVGGGGGE